jgi:uncharacterized protein YndB with AHSA1/START domain
MTSITKIEDKTDFRAPTVAKRLPRAVADAGAGVIIAVADIDGPPEAVFHALTSDEVERWWAMPGLYRIPSRAARSVSTDGNFFGERT